MSDKISDLFGAFLAGRVGRRELLQRAGQFGLGAAAATTFLNRMQSQALAAGSYDWQAQKGQSIKLLMNKHPYTDALLKNIDAFKTLTGIDVTYDVFPEDVYFDKVTAALSSRSSSYDLFMSGAYQTWQYGPAGWLVDLNKFIHDTAETSPDYDWDGILPNLRSATAWSGKPGDALGGSGAKQWALPWAWELNSIAFNKRILDAAHMEPPKNLPDLIEMAAKISKDVPGVYGIGARGSRSWATIHAGYLSAFTNYGAKDFDTSGGKLVPAMNSKQAKEFTKLWVEMLQKGGPKNWTTYTWYEVANDLGGGTSAMVYDADSAAFFQEKGTKEAGNIHYHAFTPNPDAHQPTPNVWIWSLAMSAFSKHQQAAWKLMQWATSTQQLTLGATKADLIDPTRQVVWDNQDFKTRMQGYPGYLDQFAASSPGAKIYFTPQPLFFNVTTSWAAALQKIYSNQVSVDDGLDQLAHDITSQLENAGITD
jgi:multiple sugar transport system substrate-binding protein